MTTFIYFLVYVFVAGFFGLFMLVLVAHSLIEQEKYYKSIKEKSDEHFNAIMKKIDKDYEKIIKKM